MARGGIDEILNRGIAFEVHSPFEGIARNLNRAAIDAGVIEVSGGDFAAFVSEIWRARLSILKNAGGVEDLAFLQSPSPGSHVMALGYKILQPIGSRPYSESELGESTRVSDYRTALPVASDVWYLCAGKTIVPWSRWGMSNEENAQASLELEGYILDRLHEAYPDIEVMRRVMDASEINTVSSENTGQRSLKEMRYETAVYGQSLIFPCRWPNKIRQYQYADCEDDKKNVSWPSHELPAGWGGEGDRTEEEKPVGSMGGSLKNEACSDDRLRPIIGFTVAEEYLDPSLESDNLLLGYLAFPVGPMGVMQVCSLVTPEMNQGQLDSGDWDTEYILEHGTSSGWGALFPPKVYSNDNRCMGLPVFNWLYATANWRVEYPAPDFEGHDSHYMHQWARVYLRAADTWPVPGTMVFMVCRPSPLHCWWYQETSPFAYAGNFFETAYYSSGIVKHILTQEEKNEGEIGQILRVEVCGAELYIRATDWCGYEVDQRVALLRRVGSLPDGSGHTWLDAWDAKHEEMMDAKTPKPADVKYVVTNNARVIPVSFYDNEQSPPED